MRDSREGHTSIMQDGHSLRGMHICDSIVLPFYLLLFYPPSAPHIPRRGYLCGNRGGVSRPSDKETIACRHPGGVHELRKIPQRGDGL